MDGAELRASSLEAAQEQQREGAQARVEERNKPRQRRIKVLSERGGIAKADDPARVATRIDRLSRFYADVRPVDPTAVAQSEPEAVAEAGVVLERIINTKDFLGVRYLEAGLAATRAVARVNIRDSRGQLVGYGTGSLVSPELILTNHHVLSDAEVAASSEVEFNYQDGIDGRPLQPQVFPLDPERFFLADQELDFALVAVRAQPADLAQFGFNQLIEAEGKAIVGDFVTIVQHPRGEKKQIALRENRLVDVVELFLHYETDTEPGSSGSPVFNDQWELIALHHASVPAPGRAELGGIVNEGVRVSRLVRFIREHELPAAARGLVSVLFAESETPAVPPATQAQGEQPLAPFPSGDLGTGTLQLDLPLEIRLRSPVVAARPETAVLPEGITIDPDYSNRRGYDAEFLGSGALRVPLPSLSDDLVALASINSQTKEEPAYVLPYHHFSVVQHKERKLAFFTAVNIDGMTSFRLKREDDRWFFDPRIPENEQTGEPIYAKNPLDRGHLVRRLDPAWGESSAAAKLANDDTFHFTNCTPQHEDFNQNQTTWAGLEDYILENADNRDFRVSVFTGPVLAADDEPFKGVQLPREFWKVVVMVKEGGALSATGYLLSQEELIRGLEVLPEEFSYGAYRTFQVPIQRIEELTRISFGDLAEADPLGKLEATTAAKSIDRWDEVQL